MVRIPDSINCAKDCPNRRVGCHNDSCARHVAQQEFIARQKALAVERAEFRDDWINSRARHRAFTGELGRFKSPNKKLNRNAW